MKKETGILFDVACQPLMESFLAQRAMLSVETQTRSKKGADLWWPWHNPHGAANVPCINMWSSFKMTNVDTHYRIPTLSKL